MLDAALFTRKLTSHFWFFWLLYYLFKLDPDPNPIPEPEYIPVPIGQKVVDPAILAPIPQHYISLVLSGRYVDSSR